jgi:hypothetical protein
MTREQKPGRITPSNVVGAIALFLVVAGVVYWTVNYVIEHTPLPAPADHREALANLTTARFKNMPQPRQMEYLMQTSSLLEAVPMEERRELFAQMNIPQETRNQIWVSREFNNAVRFALAATVEEKNRMLDEQIDRMQARIRERRLMMQQMEAGAGGPNGPGGQDEQAGFQSLDELRAQARAQIAASFESGNPQLAQLNAEYRRAMSERMAERGLARPRRMNGADNAGPSAPSNSAETPTPSTTPGASPQSDPSTAR